MEVTNKLRKRFAKDFNLPIQVFQEPYWSYLINLYDDHFGTLKNLELFKKEIESHNSQEETLDAFTKRYQSIIQRISSSPYYKEFNEHKITPLTSFPVSIRKSNLYVDQNADKQFIEIDLIEANFTSFLSVTPEIFEGYTDYKEFIVKTTGSDYLANNKSLRQIIFGNLNPKRQQSLQKVILAKIMTLLTELIGLSDEDFISTSNDELVISASKTSADEVVTAIQTYDQFLYSRSRVSDFFLRKIGDTTFYIKEFKNKKEIKLVPNKIFAQIYKHVFGLKISNIDLYFYEESCRQLARFDKPLKIWDIS